MKNKQNTGAADTEENPGEGTPKPAAPAQKPANDEPAKEAEKEEDRKAA